MMIDTDNLVCMSQIAELADAHLSTVSNWRARHSDFPQPVWGYGSVMLYDRDDVMAYLTDRGALREARARKLVDEADELERKARELRAAASDMTDAAFDDFRRQGGDFGQ